MKKLKSYEDFGQQHVDEKMGVPAPILPLVESVTKVLVEKTREAAEQADLISAIFGEVKTSDITINGDEIKTDANFPIDKMVFNVSFEPARIGGLRAQGAFEGGSFKLKDGKASFNISLGLVCNPMVLLGNVNNPKLYSIINDEIRSVVQHELTHAYESYKRATNKKAPSRLSDTKDFVYDITSNMIRNGHQLPQIINDLLFMIYTAASYEVNARVSQMHAVLKNVKGAHNREEAMKETDIWKVANDLATFKAQNYYDELIKLIIENTEGTDKEAAEKLADKLFGQIDKAYIDGNKIAIKHAIEDLGNTDDSAVIRILKGHDKEYKKVSKMNTLSFLKFWEKRFNKIGRDFRNKLSKLTTYEETPEEK